VADAAGAKLASLRAMCEPYVQALSTFLVMPLPEWVPSAEVKDQWHTIG
jgi:hypothetical protein